MRGRQVLWTAAIALIVVIAYQSAQAKGIGPAALVGKS